MRNEIHSPPKFFSSFSTFFLFQVFYFSKFFFSLSHSHSIHSTTPTKEVNMADYMKHEEEVPTAQAQPVYPNQPQQAQAQQPQAQPVYGQQPQAGSPQPVTYGQPAPQQAYAVPQQQQAPVVVVRCFFVFCIGMFNETVGLKSRAKKRNKLLFNSERERESEKRWL